MDECLPRNVPLPLGSQARVRLIPRRTTVDPALYSSSTTETEVGSPLSVGGVCPFSLESRVPSLESVIFPHSVNYIPYLLSSKGHP